MNSNDKAGFGAVYTFEHVRGGEVIHTEQVHNTVPNAALTEMLSVYLNSGSQTGVWYVGLFKNDYNMANAATLTASQIGTALIESDSYSDGSRRTIVFAAAASQSITNSANPATFNIDAPDTIYGAFAVSAAANFSVLGTIFSVVKLGTARDVESGDILKVTMTFTAAAA